MTLFFVDNYCVFQYYTNLIENMFYFIEKLQRKSLAQQIKFYIVIFMIDETLPMLTGMK